MGSGWVQLSPQQEVSNFKKLWLLAEVLGSFKTTPGRGGREGERCLELQHFLNRALGRSALVHRSSFPQAQAPPSSQGLSLLFTEIGNNQPQCISEAFEAHQG